ncbi:NAD-dependent epimerase/dehydratase family protein [Nitratireductor pacificus]|uniref:NAD-dependent epimerase/dehydratase n=1 Tax=Nitratireductor pacificus pht-3B TaxID=391937 RepID=K2LJY5_9HYPH|nr:NAD(P)-dependent oxidoreductase [Nitratireductor pacificus]EKF18054.1 NAD-dependent epimerase/dehydratase [Nitratireductor pacificus pht-3B]
MTPPHSIVSGGTGLVGRFIVGALLEAGHRVTVMGRQQPVDGFFGGPVAFAPLTLEPRVASTGLFEGGDFFVHAAFDHEPGKYRGGEGQDAEGFRRRNLDGSVALFRAARAAGVARTVFLSSRAVYGPRPAGELLDEQDECRPDTLYGTVKLEAERELAGLTGADFTGVSLRVTGVYGPAGASRRHKWADLFGDYLAGRAIAPRVGTEVHGRDVGAAVRLVLEAPADTVAGRVFNVSDLLLDRRDLLALVARAVGCGYSLPEPGDKGSVNAMTTARLTALGWQPGGTALLQQTVIQLLASRQAS